MDHTTRDGVRLAYVEAGRGEQSVVLLHGMACVHQHMLAVMAHLQSRFRCVAVDLRGHGASDKPETGYGMEDFVADLAHLIDDLDLGRPILIGHSFGGSISLSYADRYPEAVEALIMLDSGLRSNREVNADLGPFYEALGSGDRDRYMATLDGFVRQRLCDPLDGEVFAAEVSAVMSSVPPHVFLAMSETVRGLESAAAAARCPLPAMIVLSRLSFADPAALAALGSNWHVGQIVGAGHFLQLLVPDQVNAMIDRFLAVTSGATRPA